MSALQWSVFSSRSRQLLCDPVVASPLAADPFRIDAAEIERQLARLERLRVGGLQWHVAGRSCQGRPIFHVRIGDGPTRVLMWSQMHGDEPTHTVVLLELLSFLQRHPAAPEAAAILAGCTLHVVPGLNPDGMSATTRVNAQQVDVNRDARRLQTPEGALLRSLVESLRPDFAFNLHNQNARTAVGDPPLQAAVSLLAPPRDACDTQTPAVQRAKQAAAVFRDVVEPRCPGRISRYDADYMPRAFGEWIQGQGTSTVLVEAGGWRAAGDAGDEAWRLAALHLEGLAGTLLAVADGSYRRADVARYDALPRSSEQTLFDCLIRGADVWSGRMPHPFRADVGILCAEGRRVRPEPLAEGIVDDLGDLDVTTGREVVEAAGLACLPGAWAWLPETTPGAPLATEAWRAWLARGVTSVVGSVRLDRPEELEALVAWSAAQAWRGPGNLGFVACWQAGGDAAEQRQALDRAVAAGALAVAGLPEESRWESFHRLWRLPRWEACLHGSVPTEEGRLWASASAVAALAAGLPLAAARGAIVRGHAADLRLVGGLASGAAAPGEALRSVLTAGRVVWRGGEATGELPGRLLLSRIGAAVNAS